MSSDLDTFEEAFRDGIASCRGECECGTTFFDRKGGWDWDKNELESLIADTKAQALDSAVSFISFEGKTYVIECTCWHKRAKQITAFINRHFFKIADFLRTEKRRKERLAADSPTVEDSTNRSGLVTITKDRALKIKELINAINGDIDGVIDALHPQRDANDRKLDI